MAIKAAKPLAYAALLLALAGCFVPEKFSSRVTFLTDGAFRFTYKGTAVFAMAVESLAKKGKLDEKDDEDLRKLIPELKKDPCAKDVSYVGNGRFRLEIECEGTTEKVPGIVSTLIAIKRQPDGAISVGSLPFGDKERGVLSQIGLKIDGELRIDLPSGAQVVSENADRKPILGLGGYVWKLSSVTQSPVLRVRF